MDRPKNVVIAVSLLGATIVLSLARALLTGFSTAGTSAPPLLHLGGILLTNAVYAFFYFKIFAGKNWARIIWAIVFLLGLPGLIPMLPRLLQNPTTCIFLGLQLGLEFAALLLIFAKPGSTWFDKKKAAEPDTKKLS